MVDVISIIEVQCGKSDEGKSMKAPQITLGIQHRICTKGNGKVS